ncbi:MAG: sirohydrochlorin cobaltochelatase [Desulfovibrio sp.]|nr:sirohydrochlorin cobaltochelatase [Desulfovibrio sp.]
MRSAILLVAYGIGSDQGRHALRGFDAKVRQRWPGMPVRWAYTSLLLRERMALTRQKTDSVFKAVSRLALEKFERVAVQPLQTVPGQEHEAVCVAVREASSRWGLHTGVGAPLLQTPDDIRSTAEALIRHLPMERGPEEDVILMGHGTRHDAVSRYVELAKAVRELDRHVHVGVMNGAVSLEDILSELVSPRVWLAPLLSVVGRHTLEDMAGHSGQSWRGRIEAAGRKCLPVLVGTAEYAGVAEIWLRHLDDVVRSLVCVGDEVTGCEYC